MTDEQPTITCAGRSRPQWEAHQRANRLAAAIARTGIQRGERVAILAHNDIEWLETALAVGATGANPVPINWHWRSGEIAHVLRDANVRIIFAHTVFLDEVAAAIEQAGTATTVVEIPMSTGLITALGLSQVASPSGRWPTIEDWITAEPEPLPYQEGALSDSMGLIYTSGTTGAPKGVSRDKMQAEQLIAIAVGTAKRMGLATGGRMLVAGPLYHTSPNAVALLGLRMGTNIWILPRFDSEEFLRSVDEHKIQQAKIVPTMLSRLLSLPAEVRERYDVSSLTHLIHSAAPCPPHVKRAAIEWFGDAVWEFYGSTETGTITWIGADEWLEHPGSVGLPADGSAVVVADDVARELPAGEQGHVWVKGADYWPAFRYLNHEATDSPIPGFIDVGDEGYVDADGWLYLTGRSSDIVISGGVNIYPLEIENAILATGLAEDAAVFGVPDGEWGESLEAYVLPRPGVDIDADTLRSQLHGAIADYKIPRRITIVDELPREDSGKLFKRKFREASQRP